MNESALSVSSAQYCCLVKLGKKKQPRAWRVSEKSEQRDIFFPICHEFTISVVIQLLDFTLPLSTNTPLPPSTRLNDYPLLT